MNRKLFVLEVLLTGVMVIAGGCANRHPTSDLETSESQGKEARPQTAAAPPELVQTGRYSAITAGPTEVQRHPLRVMIQVRLPPEVGSVREAVKYLLWRSGYRLVEPLDQKTEVTALLAKPLPQVHRQLGPMALEDALQVLAGPAFHLEPDHVSRVVSYRLNVVEEPTPKAGIVERDEGDGGQS